MVGIYFFTYHLTFSNCVGSCKNFGSRMGEASSSCSSETRKKFIWSKETTIELIELYHNHPVLYMVADQNYKNKNFRQAALENIRSELLKFEFCANQCLNLNDIKSKIHTLRTQFFKEWGKVKASERSGTGAESVYQPKLWCYEELVFLTETSECTTINFTNLIDEQLETQEGAVFVEVSEDQRTNEEETIERVSRPTIVPKKKRKVIIQHHHNGENRLEEDDIHSFAMSIAAELRNIKNPRRIVQLKRDIFNRILDDQDEEIIDL